MKENAIYDNTTSKNILKIDSSIKDIFDDRKVAIVKKFIRFIIWELQLRSGCTVCLRNGRGEHVTTTASYNPHSNETNIRAGDRALVDVFRSIAHEIVHQKQREDGRITPGVPVQNIGGEIEDEANAKAGELIKKFTHNKNMMCIYDL